MGAIRTSATALLSAGATFAVLALAALGTPAAPPAASAAGPPAEPQARQTGSFGFTLTPSTVAPGGEVVLAVSGCNAAYSTASSGVFDTESIARGQREMATVDRDARPGAVYSVSFTCNGETASADLTIAGGTTRPTTSSTTVPTRSATAPAPPTRTATPTAPATRTATATATATATRAPTAPAAPTSARGVRGGLGGSVAGMDPVELGAGAALFLAAAGAGVYALRRRASGRGH
ncbi:hypothetical protein AB0N09_15055 [Streptomyces erythrochromogenes]|uniref:hypothetical protein n=1 Tax=Streptomyces erythrochromogenes TaxID=285574 RepID=UPI0034200462